MNQKKISLTAFVEEQIENFAFPDTEQSRRNVALKCRKTLKEMGLWELGETRTVGRAHHTFFTAEILSKLLNEIEPYLLKKGGLDRELISRKKRQIDERQRNYEAYVDYMANLSYEEREKEFSKQENTIPITYYLPTSTEKMEVMIAALFNELFEPLNTTKWQEDKRLIDHYNEFDLEPDTQYILARERLENPVKYYTRKK